MSKIIEELKKRKSVKSKVIPAESKWSNPGTSFAQIQDKLANTYFKDKKSNGTNSQLKAFNESGHRVLPFFTLLRRLLLPALLIGLVILFFSYDKIDINISVSSNENTAPQNALMEPKAWQSEPVKQREASQGTSVKTVETELHNIEKIEFTGSGQHFSKVTQNYIILGNGNSLGNASMDVFLKEPVDLSENSLVFTARGGQGGEKFDIIIKDTQNRSYFANSPTESLDPKWRQITISLSGVSEKTMDAKKISNLRFEYGALTAGNHMGSTIYLKDIGLIPN
jgi:uncharacterized beta-barrel protein YwiB (DUF1934 family)